MFDLISKYREDYTNHNDGTSKVSPDVHCFIMNLKETFKNLTVRMEVDAVTCKQFLVSHVFRGLVEGSNIWP